jgi:cell division protein FtsB
MSTLMSQARNRVPRFAEGALERARLSVVPRASSPRARVPFVALVSLLLVGGVAGLLFFNTSMQQVSFQATALEQKASVLEAQRQSLQMELDTLRDPQRVALQARKMGMVPPASPVFLRLGDGKVLGTPLPATVDDSFRITALPAKKPRNLDPTPIVVPPSRQALVGAALEAQRTATGTKKPRASDAQQGSQR